MCCVFCSKAFQLIRACRVLFAVLQQWRAGTHTCGHTDLAGMGLGVTSMSSSSAICNTQSKLQRGAGKGHEQGEHCRQLWHLVCVKLNYEQLLMNCQEASHAFYITGKYGIKIHLGKGREAWWAASHILLSKTDFTSPLGHCLCVPLPLRWELIGGDCFISFFFFTNVKYPGSVGHGAAFILIIQMPQEMW